MTAPHLLDTSTLSHYVAAGADRRTPSLVQRVHEVVAVDGARIAAVTAYEIERGVRKLELRHDGHTRRRHWQLFLSTAIVVGLDQPRWRPWFLAADLHARAAHATPAVVVAEADLLILATAIAHGLILVTSDRALVERCRALALDQHVEHVPVG